MRTSCAYVVVAVPAAVALAAVGIVVAVGGIAVGTAVVPCSGHCSTCRHYCT